MNRRTSLTLLVATSLTVAAAAATAAPYPEKLVRIVVPSIAGSAPDIIARQVAERLTAVWKQQVIVENKPGGNGIVAKDDCVPRVVFVPRVYGPAAVSTRNAAAPNLLKITKFAGRYAGGRG